MESVDTPSYQKAESGEIMDDDFDLELIQTFIIEFEELMELYEQSLHNVKKSEFKEQAIKDLFRIYHTLKGDASFFEQFDHFAKFASHYCELLRPLDQEVSMNDPLLDQLRMNYSALSGAISALKKDRSLVSFRFGHLMKNF